MEVEKLVRKGLRLTKPRSVNLKLRPEVADWFLDLCADAHCGFTTLLVGILEDFYDEHKENKEDHS